MMHSPPLDFEEIRPYTDKEVPEIIHRITQRPSFAPLMAHLYPNTPVIEIADQIRKVRTVADFQHTYISLAIRRIWEDSIAELTHTGLDKLDPYTAYLFVSNHRDIILDSGILNLLRYELGYATTHIAIGDNLLISPMVNELMKLNKSFIVHRTPPRQHMYAYTERLSRYIRHLITEERSSVWIAQRGGRTKDGVDLTQPSLLKMLDISGPESTAQAFAQLNIVPMAISYEYEPCDFLKAEEQLCRSQGIAYEKNDKLAIVRGIREPKGRVHLAIGKPLTISELQSLDDIPNRNARIRGLAERIDTHIHQLYRRWPVNYLAHDLLHETDAHAAHYSEQRKADFEAYLSQRIAKSSADPEAMRQMMLRIYSGMVKGEGS